MQSSAQAVMGYLMTFPYIPLCARVSCGMVADVDLVSKPLVCDQVDHRLRKILGAVRMQFSQTDCGTSETGPLRVPQAVKWSDLAYCSSGGWNEEHFRTQF